MTAWRTVALGPKLLQPPVHLGQLNVTSKQGPTQSCGFTGDIVVCGQQSAESPAEIMPTVKPRSHLTAARIGAGPACRLCDLLLMRVRATETTGLWDEVVRYQI